MQNVTQGKYRPYPQIDLPNRIWPTKTITHAPIWCSVDLRDGNQALINPMSMEKKLELFALLLKLGFKEIEVGFPSASKVEFDFLRRLVDDNFYNSTSVAQRKIVFAKTKEEIIELALNGVDLIKKYEKEHDGEIFLEYSPESFTGTELEFAAEISNAVTARWGMSDTRKVIINLT